MSPIFRPHHPTSSCTPHALSDHTQWYNFGPAGDRPVYHVLERFLIWASLTDCVREGGEEGGRTLPPGILFKEERKR